MKALISAVAVGPEDCPHVSINREGDEWVCNRCRAKFMPVNRKHNTKHIEW